MHQTTGTKWVHSNIHLSRGDKGVMMNRLSVIVVLIMVLTGCSLKLRVVMFNNTEEYIQLFVDEKAVDIDPMQSVGFDYPGERRNWTLKISTKRCDYTYELPKTLDQVPGLENSKNPLKVQIEKDFSIYLLPSDSEKILPFEDLRHTQFNGFPVKPAKVSCK